MATTSYRISSPGFVVDPQSVDLNSGRQIDWANVNDSFKGADGFKSLPAGTVVGELLGNTTGGSSAGKVSPRVATTNPATAILVSPAFESSKSDASTGYGLIVGGVLYENLLPEATGSPKTLATAVKTELAANTRGFVFEQYGDSRAA